MAHSKTYLSFQQDELLENQTIGIYLIDKWIFFPELFASHVLRNNVFTSF